MLYHSGSRFQEMSTEFLAGKIRLVLPRFYELSSVPEAASQVDLVTFDYVLIDVYLALLVGMGLTSRK